MYQNRPSPIEPIHIPTEWPDDGVLTFEQCCQILHVPQRTARDWRRRHVGPKWGKAEGTGRLYLTVGELRRFIRSAFAKGAA